MIKQMRYFDAALSTLVPEDERLKLQSQTQHRIFHLWDVASERNGEQIDGCSRIHEKSPEDVKQDH